MELDAAAYAADMDRALEAWRRSRTARLAQRQLRDAWTQAHARCGLGRTPPEPSLRQAEDDEAHTFARELDRALERAAQLDAEVAVADLLGDRPSALPAELLPGPEATLEHAPTCPDPSKTEVSQVPAGSRSMGTVIRRLSCAASRALHIPDPEPEQIEAAQRGKALPDMRLPAKASAPAPPDPPDLASTSPPHRLHGRGGRGAKVPERLCLLGRRDGACAGPARRSPATLLPRWRRSGA